MAARDSMHIRPGALTPALTERADEGKTLASVARRDLERYYWIIGEEAERLGLSEDELGLVRDVCSGTVWSGSSYRLIWAEVADALADGVAEKWDVDGEALVAKLRTLSPAACMALVDDVERHALAVSREIREA